VRNRRLEKAFVTWTKKPGSRGQLHWKGITNPVRMQPMMSGKLFDDAPSSPAGWYTAHCDGGSRGNPGPAGFGAVIESPDGQVAARLSHFLGNQTNNYAEYSGLLAVLEWALKHGVKYLRVFSDSELMVRQMKGQYKVRKASLKPLWEEARRRAAWLERFEIRHTLRGGNKEADRLANEAMDKGMGSPASQQVSESPGTRVPQVPPLGPGKAKPHGAPRQTLDGYVKDGVVHLLDGELPEGIFVKIVRE
jgi:probable phosphoglycerate mutase